MTRGGGSVGAASVEEMEPRPLGQEPRLGQLMAIGRAPSLDLPDGGGLADNVEHLRTTKAKIRFSCTMLCPFRTPSGSELENKRRLKKQWDPKPLLGWNSFETGS